MRALLSAATIAILLLPLTGCLTPPASRPALRQTGLVVVEARGTAAGPHRSHPSRIVLTFDDGPSNERFEQLGRTADGQPRTPTEAVLEVLAREGIPAAFFELTGPDRVFGGRVLEKGETALGLATLRRTLREGHVLACHWGGRYVTQGRGHPASVVLPAYDVDGDGVVDRVTVEGNALESELLDCIRRIQQAYTEEGRTPEPVEFVRPPQWTFLANGNDARPTYAALGLKMVLADARVPDGAVTHALPWLGGRLVDSIEEQVRDADHDVIVGLHDVNRRTAVNLQILIDRIRVQLTDAGLQEGVDWRFPRDADDVREALRARGE